MKVFFSALHFAYFRNFESVIRTLAERGHHVHLSADEAETFGGQALVERLASEYAGRTDGRVTWDYAPSLADEPWYDMASRLRVALDYVRFLERRYDAHPKLRLRAERRAPRVVRALSRVPGTARPLRRVLTRLERLMPRGAASEHYLRTHAPDVVLLASLTYSRSQQLDHLKNARVLGIPTAACIMSWDHLSSKALLHIAADRVLVWNDVQRREAIEMHGLPAERIVVTGAQCYDQWFARCPSRSREDFCRSVGLRPDRPFVLYVHSALSPTPEPPEPQFVREWMAALRASSDERLRDLGILVRPHPERIHEWADVPLDGFADVAFHGRNPIDAQAKADYFDSLYHSAAVVGLVTSAFLEAAVVGRPVLTVERPEYRMHQDEMPHFRYLMTVEGGLLHSAGSFDQHHQQLLQALRQHGQRDERNQRFIQSFIRPAGLERAATPAFVAAVEELARSGPTAPDSSLSDRPALRAFVRAVATRPANRFSRFLLMDERDDVAEALERERARSRDERIAAAEARRRDRLVARDNEQRAKAARQRAKRRLHLWRQLRYDLATRYQRSRAGVAKLAQRVGGIADSKSD